MSFDFAEYAEDFADAAAKAGDAETADACALLAAWARGETPPSDAARRVVERTRDG